MLLKKNQPFDQLSMGELKRPMGELNPRAWSFSPGAGHAAGDEDGAQLLSSPILPFPISKKSSPLTFLFV